MDQLTAYAKYGEPGFGSCGNTLRWITWILHRKLDRFPIPTQQQVEKLLWKFIRNAIGQPIAIITGVQPWEHHRIICEELIGEFSPQFSSVVNSAINKYLKNNNYVGVAISDSKDCDWNYLNHCFVLYKHENTIYKIDSYARQRYHINIEKFNLNKLQDFLAGDKFSLARWNELFNVDVKDGEIVNLQVELTL